MILGAYAFTVPISNVDGQTYQIEIGRPSATEDGISSDLFIQTPTNGSLTVGPVNATKTVTVGSRPYVVGDVAPFRWFNAGEFGDQLLLNNDVLQVFQSAIHMVNTPPPGCDLFDAMDSSNGRDNNLLNASSGDDTVIDSVVYGDQELNVDDVFVTFRRSLDPDRVWYARYWSNGLLRFKAVGNVFRSSQPSAPTPTSSLKLASVGEGTDEEPSVNCWCNDFVGTAGQTVQVPVCLDVQGRLPARVFMLSLSVVPLDDAPPLETPVAFSPNPLVGAPTYAAFEGTTRYAATWLNASWAGFTGSNQLGLLTIRIPDGATAKSAYAVRFGHFSASPNGVSLFSPTVVDGLLSLSDRSGSSWGDGIPDTWRLRHFGTLSNLLSSTEADADGDGMNNWQEYKAGTLPNRADSRLALVSSMHPVNERQVLTLQWPTVLSKHYTLECANSLASTNWTVISSDLIGTGSLCEFTETNVAHRAQYYRIRVND